MPKINTIESFRVLPRWLFVKITDEDGNYGWGESTLEGHSEAVEGTLDALSKRFQGYEAEYACCFYLLPKLKSSIEVLSDRSLTFIVLVFLQRYRAYLADGVAPGFLPRWPRLHVCHLGYRHRTLGP